MKFLCDEMLKGLARWLRAAGYDTHVAPDGTRDAELMALARNEGRYLITCDHKLLEFRHADEVVVLVTGSVIEEAATSLCGKVAVDWLHAPFSRCMECNTPLQGATSGQYNEVPPTVIQRELDVWACQGCGRLYWEGSHVTRIRARLEARQAMQSCTDSGIL